MPEAPVDHLARIQLALDAIADLLDTAKDLHCVDPHCIAALVRYFALDLKSLEQALSR